MLCPRAIVVRVMDGFTSCLAAGGETDRNARLSAASGRIRLEVVPVAAADDPGSFMLPGVAERFALLNLMGQPTAHARRPGSTDRARAGGLGLAPGMRSARRA